MALSDTKLRSLKPVTKRVKRFDTGGLFLLVSPNGSTCPRANVTRDNYLFGITEGGLISWTPQLN